MITVDEALSFADRMYTKSSFAGVLATEVRRLREENERLRVQLAGCGVAAMQNTADSRKDRIKSGDYGWSASYSDVCGAVDREIALREENERLRADAERYQWLRNDASAYQAQTILNDQPESIDTAIDAARGAK
jgi:hypothetical protein